MSRNTALQFVNLAHFLDHYFLLIFPTAALAIGPAWGMSYGEVLLLGTPMFVAFAVGTLPAGWLGDRMDRMMLIAVFFIGCGISSLGISLASGPVSLMVGLGFLGLFAAMYHPVGLVLVTQLGVKTGRALAINGVFGNLGLACSAVATGLLAKLIGWQIAFALPGAMAVAIGITLIWWNRRASINLASHTQARGAARLVRSKTDQLTVFGIVCVAALFGGVAFNAITISLPQFFNERLTGASGDLMWVGGSTGLVFAVAAFAQLPVGELLDKIGARSIYASLLVAEILTLLVLSQVAGVAAFVFSLLLVTLLFAGLPITTWLLGHYIEAHKRSRAVSVEYVLSLGMSALVVPLISALHRGGYGFDVQFTLLAVSACIVLCAVFFLPKHSETVPVSPVDQI